MPGGLGDGEFSRKVSPSPSLSERPPPFLHSAIRPFPKASVRIESSARSFSRTQPSGCADFKVEMHEKAVNGARRKEDRGVQGGWRGGDKEMARKRAGGKAASYHEHETTLNHKTSHRP